MALHFPSGRNDQPCYTVKRLFKSINNKILTIMMMMMMLQMKILNLAMTNAAPLRRSDSERDRCPIRDKWLGTQPKAPVSILRILMIDDYVTHANN